MLRKKNNSVWYHIVHETVAMDNMPSNKNVVDLISKVLCGQRKMYLVGNVLQYWLCMEYFLIKTLKATNGIIVKYAICDNAGGSEVFQRACKQEGMVIDCKYTTASTSQQNG